MKLLVFATLFPNRVEPQHGLFVKTRLLHYLARHGGSATVIAPVPLAPPFGPAHWTRHRAVPAVEQSDGLTVLHPRFLALPGVGARWRAGLMAASLQRAVLRCALDQQPDILDVHYAYPEGVAALRLKRVLERRLERALPMVLTCRGSDLNLWPEMPGVGAQIAATLRNVDHVVCVAEALRRKAAALGCPDAQATTLRNGVDAARFTPGPQATARARLGLPPDARIALCVGNLVENKGQHLLIEALAGLHRLQPAADWHLALVGKGEERGRLLAQAQSLGVARQVVMPGSLPAGELPDWYRAADVMALPSSREGWPNVVLESLACGLPVIATAVGGVPEILGDCAAGRLVERDVAALTAALAESARLDAAAARPWAERHSWAATSDGLAALFARLARQPAGAVPRERAQAEDRPSTVQVTG